MMRRGEGRHLLAPLAVCVLLVASCSSGDDTGAEAPAPEPTAVIEEAPAATAVPEPTATPLPEPTATSVPEPTALVEQQVASAWERYWLNAVAAQGSDPPPEALAFSDYAGATALETLERTLEEQAADGLYVEGSVVPGSTIVTIDSDTAASVADCVELDLVLHDSATGEVLQEQAEIRAVVGRLELAGAVWRVTSVDTGVEASCDA